MQNSSIKLLIHLLVSLCASLCIISNGNSQNADSVIPELSDGLKFVNVSNAVPINEDYRLQFFECDMRGLFRSIVLPKTYQCYSDKNNVKRFSKLPDGAILWDSKMSLDIDGSWITWAGGSGRTDQKLTWYQWRNISNKSLQEAQLDPDIVPYIVIPIDGKRQFTGTRAQALGQEFVNLTGIKSGDLGVAIFEDKWTPVIVGDGGPFMKLGEASPKVFELLGRSRCLKWNNNGTRCVGSDPSNLKYPYRNISFGSNVVFIVWPNTSRPDINSVNFKDVLCKFGRDKMKRIDAAGC